LKLEPGKILQRYKRQYFKPSIDGSWLANERSLLLKHSKQSVNQYIIQSTTRPTNEHTEVKIHSNLKQSFYNSTELQKTEVSVTSLALSLISLFDRIKGTLCKIINQECNNIG
jgi:hypothetical protein